MSEPTALTSDLERDLRNYFAVTTAVELPRPVREMSARTLTARRRPLAALLAGAAGVLASVALVFVLATHAGLHGAGGGASSALHSASEKANGFAPPAAAQSPQVLATISYPGVDTSRLADKGVRLLLPAGHGSALLTPAQAQASAVSRLGATAGAPGPAVLAFAQLVNGPQPTTCLCWVVDVPVSGGVVGGSPGPALRTELVLVDALNGRLVTALYGNGVP